MNLELARDLLLKGEVVAIPTETVYGLGGWINSREGLLKIFSTKERPFFDPLIVHVSGIENAKKLTSEWTVVHETLARECWPGPLTLIAKKNNEVDPLITSGLDSVGLRCPKHNLTLELLATLEGGIAAPSANKFGKTSPTSATHVAVEFDDEVAILDGGSCEIGIESTVVGVRKEAKCFIVEIFRPGFFTAKAIELILTNHNIAAKVLYTESPVAPGQLEHHYMPNIPLVLVPAEFCWDAEKEKIEGHLGKKFSNPATWVMPESAVLASRELYEKLRQFDQLGFDIILTTKLSCHHSEEWMGIWNRLEKAKALAI
ncbi:MAG TPA: L-threonylcarbamoyladenylate synthase [Bacteriovoracaceae bacterium]|nr:L-threonylcarbamoyladenylate synthase [Bacteriovoracaceae bacterium]